LLGLGAVKYTTLLGNSVPPAPHAASPDIESNDNTAGIVVAFMIQAIYYLR
jgi:hypothetical protein